MNIHTVKYSSQQRTAALTKLQVSAWKLKQQYTPPPFSSFQLWFILSISEKLGPSNGVNLLGGGHFIGGKLLNL